MRSALTCENRASFSAHRAFPQREHQLTGGWNDSEEANMLRGGLLWLLGIPLPIILLLWFFGVFH